MRISHRFLFIAAVFLTCLITSNTIAVKVVSFGSFVLPAAIFVFPLSYLFGDIITEVYGYTWSRRVIWIGFVCNCIFVFFTWVGQYMPAAPFWSGQDAYQAIFSYTPRLLASSFLGYLAGSFVNSYILARMKVVTRGRWLWSRTIASTIVGEGLDTAIFILFAYWGTPVFSPIMILNHWLVKVGIEVVLTPLTYLVVNSLKKKESMDPYDTETNFSPFSMKIE
jgi:uncharacterized integral membrane protein (TIGR00697 family)